MAKYYYVDIDLEDEETGVFFNSIVNVPAHLRRSVNFSKAEKEAKEFSRKDTYAVSDSDKRIVVGVMIAADQWLIRDDPEMGQYYCCFRPGTITAIMEKYMRVGAYDRLNLNHDHDQTVEGAHIVETYQVSRELGKHPDSRLPDAKNLKDGSWVAYWKINNSGVWEKVKTGEYGGFSVEISSFLKPAKIKGHADDFKARADRYAAMKQLKKELKEAGVDCA